MQILRDFKQSALVKQALTTKGYAYEHQLDYDNQRLEFLGDAVMDLIVSQHLFQQTELTEGQLTRLRLPPFVKPVLPVWPAASSWMKICSWRPVSP